MLFPQFLEFGLSELLLVIAGFAFVLIVINYLINLMPLAVYKNIPAASNAVYQPVSIVICAKNEEENLTGFLPKILSQDYPEFEVVVVNDCSFDNTENVIDEFAKIFPNLKKITIKEDAYYKHGKKFALLVGIKGTKYNQLLMTDADCYPASNQWLQEIASKFSNQTEIVLGYGAYEKINDAKENSFLNKLIRYDAFIIAVQYLSAAIKNKAYMGVGRNLAYTKNLFFKNKGFSNHYQIKSGDDDLFVNEASNNTNTGLSISHESITYSKSKTNFKDWKLQKSRHLTTAPLYTQTSKFRLMYSWFSLYFFYLSLFSLCLSINTLLLFPIILILKMIIHLVILNKACKKLNEPDLLFRGIIYEFLLLIIYPAFYIHKLFFKPNKWTN